MIRLVCLRDGVARRDNSLMREPKKLEIKVSLDALVVERARAEFQLTDQDAAPGSVLFCERLDKDDAGVELGMLDRNIIVRLRGGERSDWTVKFRRDGPFELPAGWDNDDEHEFKLESVRSRPWTDEHCRAR